MISTYCVFAAVHTTVTSPQVAMISEIASTGESITPSSFTKLDREKSIKVMSC